MIFTYKIRYSSVEKNKKGIFLGRTLQTVYTYHSHSDGVERGAIDGIKPTFKIQRYDKRVIGRRDGQPDSL
jgi:hypothetical protein